MYLMHSFDPNTKVQPTWFRNASISFHAKCVQGLESEVWVQPTFPESPSVVASLSMSLYLSRFSGSSATAQAATFNWASLYLLHFLSSGSGLLQTPLWLWCLVQYKVFTACHLKMNLSQNCPSLISPRNGVWISGLEWAARFKWHRNISIYLWRYSHITPITNTRKWRLNYHDKCSRIHITISTD